MSLSTYYLEYGRHLARLRRRRRRRAYAPTSNTASHDNHEKIHWWVSLDFHIRDAYGAPLGGPSGRRSSAIKLINTSRHTQCKFFQQGFIMPTLIEDKVVTVSSKNLPSHMGSWKKTGKRQWIQIVLYSFVNLCISFLKKFYWTFIYISDLLYLFSCALLKQDLK